jgi:hypothetical protein
MRLALSPAESSAGLRRLTAGRSDAILLGLVLCLPIPVLAATGLTVPLPTGVVEAFVAIVPGGGDAATRAAAPAEAVGEAPVVGAPDVQRVQPVRPIAARARPLELRPDPPAARRTVEPAVPTRPQPARVVPARPVPQPKAAQDEAPIAQPSPAPARVTPPTAPPVDKSPVLPVEVKPVPTPLPPVPAPSPSEPLPAPTKPVPTEPVSPVAEQPPVEPAPTDSPTLTDQRPSSWPMLPVEEPLPETPAATPRLLDPDGVPLAGSKQIDVRRTSSSYPE